MSVSTKQFHETNFLVCHIINILLTLVGYLRTLDARGLLARQRRGASERVVLRDSPSLLRHSILLPPTRKKTSGTQGITWENLDIDVTEKQIFYPRPSTLDTLPSTLDPRPSTKTYTPQQVVKIYIPLWFIHPEIPFLSNIPVKDASIDVFARWPPFLNCVITLRM